MRNSIKSLVILLLFLSPVLSAQEISKLTVPSSPAFSILNFEPTAIMRPTNARALASDVLNAFDKEGTLLLNLGLEVSPYWLRSKPNLTRATYLRPSLKQTFLQSLGLSAATVKDSITGANKLGGGFRFKLYNGEPVEELELASADLKKRTTVVSIINGVSASIGSTIDTKEKAIDAIVNALTRKELSQPFIDDLKKEAALLAGDYNDDAAGIRQFLEQLMDNRVEAYRELSQHVSNLLYQRKGFIMEFAGATSFNTSGNTGFDRAGFWANASYYLSPDDLFSLTARYMGGGGNNDSSIRNFDVGIGFLKKTPSINISVESMLRWYKAEVSDRNINNQYIKRLEKDFTYRLAVQGSYALTREFNINLSFGKDFNAPFITSSGYFSILGFNYSLFSKRPVEIQ
jgi:hypothetical protein